MDKETYEKIKNDENFNPAEWSGGNFDDAFWLGHEFAFAEMKYEVDD